MIDYPDTVWNKQQLTEYFTPLAELLWRQDCVRLRDSICRTYLYRYLLQTFIEARHYLQSLPLP